MHFGAGRAMSGGRARPVRPVRPLRRLGAAVIVVGFACVSSAHVADSRVLPDHRLDGTRLSGPEAQAQPWIARTSMAPAVTVVHEVAPARPRAVLTGEATYYADKFEGRRTASGIAFRQAEMYAAHRTLPFGTVVRVTNIRNGRSTVVRIVDRGPWGSAAKRRNTIIDLSRSAAERLDYIRAGRTPVRVEVMLWGVS